MLYRINFLVFYIRYYANTAVHNETSCDAQAHNIYNTL